MVSSNVETSIPPNLLKIPSPSLVNDDIEQTQPPPTISLTSAPPSITITPLHKIILFVGVAIIVIGGMFYLIKLLIRKNGKNRGSKDHCHNGDDIGKRNSFIHFNGSNRLQEKEMAMVEERKKVTAADHLKAIKERLNKISQSFINDIDQKEWKGNRNFETEDEEELSDLESQSSYNNNSNSDDSKSTIRPVNNNTPINHATKLPQPVYFPPSPPISSSSSSPSPTINNDK